MEKSTGRNFKQGKREAQGRTSGKGPQKRSWPVALAWAAAFVGGAIALGAVINPLFGRFVHWDWMAGLAPTILVLAALALRRRWV